MRLDERRFAGNPLGVRGVLTQATPCDEDDDCRGAANRCAVVTPQRRYCTEPAGHSCTRDEDCGGSGRCEGNAEPRRTCQNATGMIQQGKEILLPYADGIFAGRLYDSTMSRR